MQNKFYMALQISAPILFDVLLCHLTLTNAYVHVSLQLITSSFELSTFEISLSLSNHIFE